MTLAKLIKLILESSWGARAFVMARRGSMAPMLALTLPVILMIVAGSIDFSLGVSSKSQLQDAADAASLAVAVAVAANPNTPESTLRTLAQTTLASNFPKSTPVISDFHVCAPVQADCVDNGVGMKMNTVTIGASTSAACTLAGIVPMVCSNNGAQTVNARTTTVIGFGATMQLNIVMDSSASMIVGATPNDVQLIDNWMSYSVTTKKNGKTVTTYPNWNAMKPNDPGPAFAGGDNPPCAFACHDVGGSTQPSDIAMGLTNAHTAGATTRFDVMISAAQQLISNIQSQAANNTMLAKNNYLFNIMSFDTSLHNYGSTNMSYSAAQSAVSSVSPGLDTYLSNAMASLVTAIGANGTGASAASPLKFMILVTDGLQSDRNANWSGTTGYDPAWNFNPTTFGGYATTISASQCAQLKNNGVVLAVLETPYVPLTGQSPQVQPYEKTVRHVIYPNGPNTTSAVSTALSNCATTGYYFQAASSSDIATGFLTLTNKFLAQSSYIAK